MYDIPSSCSIPSITVRDGTPYDFGFEIGKKFSDMIKSRLARDPHVHSKLLPFAATQEGQELVKALSTTNRSEYPLYWDELQGTAHGSGAPFLELLLLNLRKEIAPFLPEARLQLDVGEADQCSDVLMCTDDGEAGKAFIAHNEDADASVKDHAYLVQYACRDDLTFVAYTYAGELPSCAFGFNTAGFGFTLNAVPLAPEEAVAGGIGRNFISRDLLESLDLEDALRRIKHRGLATGHNYNLLDLGLRKIVTVETASKSRFSQKEIGAEPFFHANMYRHLQVPQVVHESSVHREKRALHLPAAREWEALDLLGDSSDTDFPIYMQGPQLCTLCTVLFDIENFTMTIYRGNPREKQQDLVINILPFRDGETQNVSRLQSALEFFTSPMRHLGEQTEICSLPDILPSQVA